MIYHYLNKYDQYHYSFILNVLCFYVCNVNIYVYLHISFPPYEDIVKCSCLKPMEKFSPTMWKSLDTSCGAVGQLPRVSGEDPERIRVDSVVETLVLCSLFFVSKFSHFLYSTVQKSAVQYSYSFIILSML